MSRPLCRLLSSNVQGLADVVKRNRLFSKWARSSIDLILLQETDISTPQHRDLCTAEAQAHGFGSCFTVSGRTAILWRLEGSNGLTLRPIQTNAVQALLPENQQRHLSDATFQVGTESLTVVSVYAPPNGSHRRIFFHRLAALPSFQPNTIFGGDWNDVEDMYLDSSNPDGTNTSHQSLNQFVQSHSCFDMFRELYGSKKLFTNNGTNGTNRRLDRFYGTPAMHGLACNMSTWQAFGSTHCPVRLDIPIWGGCDIGPGYFKVGLHFLKREGVPELLRSIFRQTWRECHTAYGDDVLEAWDACKGILATKVQALVRRFNVADKSRNLSNRDAHEGFALRCRTPSSLIGHESVQRRLKQVRQQSIIPAVDTPKA